MRPRSVAFTSLVWCFLNCASAFVVPSASPLVVLKPNRIDASAQGPWQAPSPSLSPSALQASNNNDEASARGNLPLGPILLAVIAVQASLDLITEIPKILSAGASPDYIGMGLDVFFVGYAIQNLLQQTGARQASSSASSSLEGLECCLVLDVGREPGTWMEQDWAASGARLVLPVNVRFTEEELDLGFPGEEGLGGRFCKKLAVLDNNARFVGPEGEVIVNVQGGGWASLPLTERKGDYGEGASKLRFFLDFPDGASRNDVRLPAGRVFFSGLCFADRTAASLKAGESLMEGPGGTGILTDGGLTIKKNGLVNLYGALGDVNLILGRYKTKGVN